MGRILCVANQKGGVGKTSLAMNLAWFLDTAGGRTMVLDADPQRSATRWAAAHNGAWGVRVRCVDAERDIAVVSRDIARIASEAGAEFVVVICGDIMTMPGLPRVPAANSITVNEAGEIEGLF